MTDQGNTGTRDETFDLISTLYHALQAAETCEMYADDAEDDELRQFHQRSHQMHTQLADEGKTLLFKCLQREHGGDGESANETGATTADYASGDNVG